MDSGSFADVGIIVFIASDSVDAAGMATVAPELTVEVAGKSGLSEDVAALALDA